ncbi:MAG TPA: aminotransferase class IV [Solirubrobacteraceae bacterium]|nr:aminotransferase class IV [Solirubrobacteraceae bacterium]
MTNSVNTVLRWTGRELELAAAGPAAALLVADSWLVDAGRVRAADAHWARFGGSCAQLGIDHDELARFRSAAAAALPGEGRWFPRVELTAAGLALRVRDAPPSSQEAHAIVASPGDPRREPQRKGPDLELLGGLRRRALERGADEVILCDDAGGLLEGAYSSLLWWEGDVLCTTPDERVLAGVTRALLLEIARERGVEVRMRSPRPEELAGAETWLTSALHGIRVVSAWIAPSIDAGAGLRAPDWRAELDSVVGR